MTDPRLQALAIVQAQRWTNMKLKHFFYAIDNFYSQPYLIHAFRGGKLHYHKALDGDRLLIHRTNNGCILFIYWEGDLEMAKYKLDKLGYRYEDASIGTNRYVCVKVKKE